MRDPDPEQVQASPASGRGQPASLWTIGAIALAVTVAAPLGALALMPSPGAEPVGSYAEAPAARLRTISASLLPAPLPASLPTPPRASPSAATPPLLEALPPEPVTRAVDLPASAPRAPVAASPGELPPTGGAEGGWTGASANGIRTTSGQAVFRLIVPHVATAEFRADERSLARLASTASLAFAIAEQKQLGDLPLKEMERGFEAVRSSEIERGAARRMERGAESMDRGARTMAEEARKLRSFSYRELQIAKAAERGDVLTHAELLDAIPELEKGSRELIEGAVRMRRDARRMPLAS